MHAQLPMLTITDQGTSSEQISTQICILITSGQLLPGARLPSVRSLAHTLHLAPNTVANAYHALERGGWITTPGRKATSVVASPPALSREEQLRPLRITIQHLLAQAAQLGLSAAQLHEEVDQHLLIRAAPLSQ